MKRILIIDDSLAIRTAMRRILQSLGFDVVEAPDGAAALAVCATGAHFDALLCDIDMPVLDGLSFVRELRQRTDLPQPPVVMCTTHNSFASIQEALSRGANEYVMKPFNAEIIAGKLEAVGVRP